MKPFDRKVLIVDALYPSQYATWRNREIEFFLRRGADVLVFHIPEFAGNKFSLDWEFANRDGLLEGRQVQVFDDKYAEQADESGFSVYHAPAAQSVKAKRQPSYAILSSKIFDLRNYDAVWHVFLRSFQKFNRTFSFPLRRQIIHLYPGGGWDFRHPIALPTEVRVVSTHPLTSQTLSAQGIQFIDCWTGPMFGENERCLQSRKPAPDGHLRVVTASMGSPEAKGLPAFFGVADRMTQDPVKFRVVAGNAPERKPSNVQHIGGMNFVDLEAYYRTTADVFVSLETGIEPNGWPLGLEAAKSGCALLTTDPLGVASRYGNRAATPTVVAGPIDVVSHIRELVSSPNYLVEEGEKASKFVWNWAGPENQQYRWLDFIENSVAGLVSQRGQRRWRFLARRNRGD